MDYSEQMQAADQNNQQSAVDAARNAAQKAMLKQALVDKVKDSTRRSNYYARVPPKRTNLTLLLGASDDYGGLYLRKDILND